MSDLHEGQESLVRILVAALDELLQVALGVTQLAHAQLQLSHVEQCLVAFLVEVLPALRGTQCLVIETEAVSDAGRLASNVNIGAEFGRLAVLGGRLPVVAALQRQLRLQQMSRSLGPRLLVREARLLAKER